METTVGKVDGQTQKCKAVGSLSKIEGNMKLLGIQTRVQLI